MVKTRVWTKLDEDRHEVPAVPAGFQAWLLSRKAHDNPRGDAIREYQGRASRGYLDDLSPEGTWGPGAHPCYEAQREIRRLVAEWRRDVRAR